MKRYETYKDSGIQWVGEIPSHWDSNKLKFFADISTGTTPSTANEEYWNEATENWYTPADFNEGDIHLNGSSRKVSAMAFEKSACKVFKKNVVLVVGIGATLGKIGFSRVECSANQQINAIEFYDNVYPLFGAYYLSSLKEVMKSLASAATLAIMNQSVTGSIPFVCPTLVEQKNIAAFLDNKVGQIDTTIAEKEQMLEDLKAYRSAIVSEAVTKGLDKNVEMKDSGVEWIGMIPKHWVTKRLKFVSDNFDGTHYSPETKENGKPYVTAADIRGKGIDYASTKKISQKDYDRLVEQGCKIENNDVLLVKDGATTGRVGLMIDSEECVALSSVAMLRPKEGIYPLFLMYCMMSNAMQTQITNSMAGSAMPRITLTKLNEFVVCVPHLDEQRKIAAFVDGKIEKIDRTIDEINIQIDALKSYKTTLITEAVTGKIDLRDWKPKEEKV